MFSYNKYLGKHDPTGFDSYELVTVEGSPMPCLYFNNRPVYVGDICYRGVDSFIESASWADTGHDLDDEELEALANSTDYLAVKVLDHYGYGVK
jgi:hypothetical protein